MEVHKTNSYSRIDYEAEFIAIDLVAGEAEWLRKVCEDIPRWLKPVLAVIIHCYSQSAIGRARNVIYNGKSKHIRRRHNTMRQYLSQGVITIDYVKSNDNLADPLTKSMTKESVKSSLRGIGLKPIVKD